MLTSEGINVKCLGSSKGYGFPFGGKKGTHKTALRRNDLEAQEQESALMYKLRILDRIHKNLVGWSIICYFTFSRWSSVNSSQD